jgi:hypothetical protein
LYLINYKNLSRHQALSLGERFFAVVLISTVDLVLSQAIHYLLNVWLEILPLAYGLKNGWLNNSAIHN